MRLVRQSGFREFFDPFDGTGRGATTTPGPPPSSSTSSAPAAPPRRPEPAGPTADRPDRGPG